MEILGSDVILIDYNGTLAKFEAKDLSSHFGTKDNIEEVSKELDAMLETIIDLSVSFGSTHYTKSEIKENYATKVQCNTILENTNYSSESEIDTEMAKYLQKDTIDEAKKAMNTTIDEQGVPDDKNSMAGDSTERNQVFRQMAHYMINEALGQEAHMV